MTIRSLDLVAPNGGLNRSSVSQLKGKVLGIDATYFLFQVFGLWKHSESSYLACTEESEQLKSILKNYLEAFRNNDIQPLFIFNGISCITNCVRPNESSAAESAAGVNGAWNRDDQKFDPYSLASLTVSFLSSSTQSAYYSSSASSGANHPSSRTFVRTVQQNQLEYACELLKQVLDEQNCTFFVAPYLAMAQLCYFLQGAPKKYIDAVYGPEDLLLFGVKKVITRMVLADQAATPVSLVDSVALDAFEWIDGRTVLSQHFPGLSWSQFVDACLLSGTAFTLTLPQVDGPFPLKQAAQLVTLYGSAYHAVHHLTKAVHTPFLDDYMHQLKQAICITWYYVCMDSNGVTTPRPVDGVVPHDIHEYIGTRFPAELYYYVSQSLIPCKIIGALATGCFNDPASVLEQHGGNNWANSPAGSLSRNDSAAAAVDQRRFVDDIEEIWSQALNLLTQPLHRFYQARDVVSLHNGNQQASLKVMHPYDPPLYHDTRSWMLQESALPSAANSFVEQNKPIPFSVILEPLNNATFVEESLHNNSGSSNHSSPISKKTAKKVLRTAPEILVNALYRFFQIRNFISTNHQLTSWGAPLLKALQSCVPEYQEAMFVAFEMLRLRQLREPKAASGKSAPADSATIDFLSKLATFLPYRLQQNDQADNMTCPLSHFHLLHASFASNLGELYGTVTASMLLNGNIDRYSLQPKVLRQCQPFRLPNGSVTSGNVIQSYFTTFCNSVAECGRETAIQKALASIASQFPNGEQPIRHIQSFYSFWQSLLLGIKEAEGSGAVGKLFLHKLMDVDTWLTDKIPSF
ncbi:XP-G family nuclease [Schizosaccharomyces japonicus yFS275]|uniref:XP-G family nuclease n=1 Tax=Schizosaccharomyces japonicus (strain yFS275 / FY16936) TaxID=402676 RepID=B6JW97_SCHJY|nr:XP-G family nuclease [Schizosaccharomyces japonicus yFS275]EEB05648.2 XP-G family nuclease [Schizosaccharomyces japonicus yFS275]